jgi:uncharacterized protein YdhG (YjbR/CyaY superfamily)
MRSDASTVQEYLESLPDDRKEAMTELRKVVINNLPKGFEEMMCYGMIGFVVPHSLYSPGYHCNPSQPLPFINIASQKNFIAFYHMGLYGNKKLFDWFTEEYPKHCKSKLDIGKSCVRFKKTADIPFQLIAELAKKISPADWVKCYEAAFKK